MLTPSRKIKNADIDTMAPEASNCHENCNPLTLVVGLPGYEGKNPGPKSLSSDVR